MAQQYIALGVILAALSGLSLAAFMVSILPGRRRPLYLRKLPKKAYPEAFLDAACSAYEAVGDIRGMLVLLQGKWKSGTAGKRIPAALEYLEHSRYRDYETALHYLSDQTEHCEAVLQEILEKEIRKQRGLVCKY